MPSEQHLAPAPAGALLVQAPAPAGAAILAQACRALWLATLGLMASFMHTRAPAHRALLARRIARNLSTLADQPDCFDARTRDRFARLSQRWSGHAELAAAGEDTPSGGQRLLQSLAALRFSAR